MNGRRLIYAVMIAVVAIPILAKLTLTPARMVAAEKMYQLIEGMTFKEGEVAMLWLDFGPSSVAENQAQSEVILEHLFRRRIPTIVVSQYVQAETFLKNLPLDTAERLTKENSGQSWKYGEDWINVGYKPGAALFMQGLAKSDNISALLGKDTNGTELSSFPKFAKVGGLEQIKLVGEVTSLVGVFDSIIQFFQKDGYRPLVVHGCTSITVPEAYIFLDSGQLNGLLEGIAGAAWYSQLLSKANPTRAADTSLVRSTALSIAQLAVMALIFLGNAVAFVTWLRRKYA